MECSLPATFQTKAATSGLKTMQAGRSPPKSMLHVNFDPDTEEIHERKKKYLTAKYGQHQMSLIKKRLRVEMWMYDQLQFLYGCTDDSDTYEVEIDLDELLDIEAELARREWLRIIGNFAFEAASTNLGYCSSNQKKLVDVKQSEEAVERFITELLQRAKTL